MIARLLADVVVVVHAAFVAFVVLGGLLAIWWPRVAWFHLPCAAYGAAIEIGRWICPLTPLEIELRRLGGEAGYRGGFVEHYVVSSLYPELPSSAFWLLAGVVILVNAATYGAVLAIRRKKRAEA